MMLNKIKADRILWGMTQKDMAMVLGIKQSAYAQKESEAYDDKSFTLEECLTLAKFFKYTTEDFNAIFLNSELPNGKVSFPIPDCNFSLKQMDGGING